MDASIIAKDKAEMLSRLRDKTLVIQHPERDRIADEIERLWAAGRALISAVANDETGDTVLRSRAYAEAQHIFCIAHQQSLKPTE